METAFVEFGGLDLHLGNFGQVGLVVDAVAEHISEAPQSPLQTVRRALFLRLFESRRFTFAVLDVSVADVFVVCPISKSDSHDDRQAHADLHRLRMLLHEVDLDVLDARRPAVEAKDLVRQGDAFLGRDIVQLLPSWAGAGGYVLGTELLVQPTL